MQLLGVGLGFGIWRNMRMGGKSYVLSQQVPNLAQ
jgi:hypothetical protein